MTEKLLPSAGMVAILLIVASLSTVFFPVTSGEPGGSWWDSDWDYCKNITIGNNLVEYQMKLIVGKSTGGDVHCEGHCNDNFSDLRFIHDDTSEIPYWIESYVSGDYAIVWVNNNYNDEYINMYYGNSGVGTTSDGINTFLNFCDFDNHYQNGWADTSTGTGTATFSTTHKHGTHSVKIDSPSSDNLGRIDCTFPYTGGDYRTMFWLYWDEPDARWYIQHHNSDSINSRNEYLRYWYQTGNKICLKHTYFGSSVWSQMQVISASTWYKIVTESDFSTETYACYIDDDLKEAAWYVYDDVDVHDYYKSFFQVGESVAEGKSMYIDTWCLMKFTHDIEPSWSSFGSEQSKPAGWQNSNPVAISPNPPDTQTGVAFSLTNYYNHFNISITDRDNANQSVNVTWRTNESGTWLDMGYNESTEMNATFYCTNVSWVDTNNIKYWWSVNVSDNHTTKGWTNHTYSFTTTVGVVYEYSEDFEDDTVGLKPSEDWYTIYDRYGGNWAVSDTKALSGSQSLYMTGSTSIGGDYNFTSSVVATYFNIAIYVDDASDAGGFKIMVRDNDVPALSARIRWHYNGGLYAYDGLSEVDTGYNYKLQQWENWTINFNWTDNKYEIIHDTISIGWYSFVSSEADDVNGILICGGSGYQTDVYYDNLEISSGEEPWSNSNPENSNPVPSNGAVSVPVDLSQLNITVADLDAANQSMNITWRTNASGTWKDMQANNTVSNGTYYCLNTTWITKYGTKYWWSVNTSDNHTTKGWDNDTYYFTTETKYFNISIDQTNYTNYGFRYPITYNFTIPDMTGLKCYRINNTQTGTWVQLTEKTSASAHAPTTVENGIEMVRFDYDNDTAYVSVGLSSETNYVVLKFTDSSDNVLLNCSFNSIPQYYDNRKAAVTMTWDDWWDGKSTDFTHACNITQGRNIWASPGVVTRNAGSNTSLLQSTWDDMQTEVNQGCIDLVAHSRTHPHLTNPEEFWTLDWEINGSKQDILANITMSYGQYVYAFLYPYGDDDSSTHAKCGEHHYLIDRDIYTHPAASDFSSWDATNNMYGKAKADTRFGSDGAGTNPSTFNSIYNTNYNAGGIYHLMSHPSKIESDNAWANFEQHCDYIANHTDVWYVGYGLMYLYHYAQERDIPMVTGVTTEITPNNPPTQSGEVPVNASTDISLTPDLYVLCNDADNDNMNATWWSNSSGSWLQFASNWTSFANNTNITQSFTNASACSTIYYWSINLTDGIDWINETYRFTTFEDVTIDIDISPDTWNIGTLAPGACVQNNYTFYQNGDATISITIGVNDTNFTFVNYTTWSSNGHDRYCANFTNDSWVTEHMIEPDYPPTTVLNSSLGGSSNFAFGIRVWGTKTVTVNRREDFEVVTHANRID